MSTYSENYKKVMDGYTKIYNTIVSVEVFEQLECIPNMVDNWINLIDRYCDEVYYDKTNRSRKADAHSLGNMGRQMFQELKQLYQGRLQALQPREYEGGFKPCRVKSIAEMAHEQEQE
jgi:hypothetical protein